MYKSAGKTFDFGLFMTNVTTFSFIFINITAYDPQVPYFSYT